ncbi:MAG: hypothetical protein J5720_05455 [Bacteroidaceae bacterium]|nr:hypothetical protein [Bacteroidaceae bacterium]
MEKINDIEKKLKPKAVYHASPKVKERVMAEMAKIAAPIGGNTHRWWQWAGFAASLLIIAGIGWMLLNKNTKVLEDREKMAENGSQMLTDSLSIHPASFPSMEDTKPDASLTAQVTESPKPQKRIRQQTVSHKTAVEASPVIEEELLEREEERAAPVDVQDGGELEAMLNGMQQPQSTMSEEEEYMHMNIKVFTANIRIRNKQEQKN